MADDLGQPRATKRQRVDVSQGHSVNGGSVTTQIESASNSETIGDKYLDSGRGGRPQAQPLTNDAKLPWIADYRPNATFPPAYSQTNTMQEPAIRQHSDYQPRFVSSSSSEPPLNEDVGDIMSITQANAVTENYIVCFGAVRDS